MSRKRADFEAPRGSGEAPAGARKLGGAGLGSERVDVAVRLNNLPVANVRVGSAARLKRSAPYGRFLARAATH